jgi:hypothetical protein
MNFKEKVKGKVCVVHLVRKKNGIDTFEKFLKSYKSFYSCISHELIIIYKGFKYKGDILPYEKKMLEINHQIYRIPDIGYDVNAYFWCFKKYQHNFDYFCFLNSFSEINAKGWLRKLIEPLNDKSIGLVGASSSYGSMVPIYHPSSPSIPLWKKILKPLLLPLLIKFRTLSFNKFPNPHIRTNGFIISRSVLSSIKFPLLFRKCDAYKFESGKFGLTNQVKLLGLKCVIVGKDGSIYNEIEWPQSNIFWSSKQENLLIKDNQTNSYENSNFSHRKKLNIFAWKGF